MTVTEPEVIQVSSVGVSAVVTSVAVPVVVNSSSSTSNASVSASISSGSGGPGSLIHEHTQETPSLTWIINHVLPYRPSVQVADQNGDVLMAEIDYVSDTEIHIIHETAQTGAAYLS